MKILFPLGSFYPDQSGGPSNTLYWHCKFLQIEGFNPVIVTTDHGIPIEMRNKWIQTNYGTVIYTSNIFHQFPFTFFFHAIKELRKTELLHLTSVFYFPSLIVFLINFIFFHKPVIWSVRGEFDEKALVYKSKIKSIYILIVKYFSKNTIWHSTSSQESQYIKKVISNNIKIVQLPNFIEIPSKLNLPNVERKYFLYIGRLHPKKGIDFLIKGMSLSKSFKYSEYQLIIAGDDKDLYADSLKELCKTLGLEKKIKFIGPVVGEQKEKLFYEAYFTILPSHTENFGNVVVESLCQGTPVVASTGTPWECLVTSQAGYWESNSPENLAQVIDTLLHMENETYEKYRINAYNLVLKDFDIKKNISTWVSLYRSILDKAKS